MGKIMKRTNATYRERRTVGRSGTTPIKQRDVSHIIESQVFKTYCVFNKALQKKALQQEPKWFDDSEFCYIDCTAGDMDLHFETSPKMFIDSLSFPPDFKSKLSDFESKLYLIEKNECTFDKLEKNWIEYCTPKHEHHTTGGSVIHLQTINSNFIDVLKEIPKCRYRYGLIYHDPNTCIYEDYTAIFKFLRQNIRMDVLLNVNTGWLNNRARPNTAKGFEKYSNFYLVDIINGIKKKYVWIRDNTELDGVEDASRYEFVLLFATNMEGYDFPIQSNFVPAKSTEGEELIQKYNYNKKEKDEIERRKNRRTIQNTIQNQRGQLQRNPTQYQRKRI
jgi:hypothetical protein